MKLFEAAWELKNSSYDKIIMGDGPGGDWPQIHAPLLNQFMVFSTTETGWHLAQRGEINVPDLKTAWSLLQYTEDKDETRTNSKLVSALLFMLHISSEIVKSFTFGDETDTKELLDEAITEANFAYKNKNGMDLTETLNKAKMN